MIDLITAKTNYRTRIKVAEKGAKARKVDLKAERAMVTDFQKRVKSVNHEIRNFQSEIGKGLRTRAEEDMEFTRGLVSELSFTRLRYLRQIQYHEDRIKLLRANLKQNYLDREFYINRLRTMAEKAAEASDVPPTVA